MAIDRDAEQSVVIVPAAGTAAGSGVGEGHHSIVRHKHVVKDERLAASPGKADHVPGRPACVSDTVPAG
jgi:hypothetical protein